MSESTANGWSEEQWARVRQAIQEEARRSRIAASFLPLVGPVPAQDFTIPKYGLSADHFANHDRGESHERLVTDEVTQLVIATIAVEVYLRGGENADPNLNAAMSHFRRAANVVARAEDALVFSGQAYAKKNVAPPIFRITGGDDSYPGLFKVASSQKITVPRGKEPHALGQHLVSAVVEGIQVAERQGHVAPFVCVLGDELYKAAMTPDEKSLVLPSDRIVPFLSQPLLRTSTLDPNQGVLLSLAGDPIELVVATDLKVDFLQVSLEPRFIYRVSERVILRVREDSAAVALEAPKTKK